jgi:hypothetical protein
LSKRVYGAFIVAANAARAWNAYLVVASTVRVGLHGLAQPESEGAEWTSSSNPKRSRKPSAPPPHGFKKRLELVMFTAHVIVTFLTIAANTFGATLDFVRYKQVLTSMARVGVPESWLTFPMGTLKTAGALGLLLGLIGVPLIGTAAAIGLIMFFACAIYAHLLARDYSPQFGLAIGFLLLAVATLVLDLLAS